MIAKLTGKAEILDSESIILDVNGVGYKVFVIQKLLESLRAPYSEPRTLFIYTHVRDDALDLYGFATKDELQLFKLIISVSGVGPKTGIHIMDKGVNAITQAVNQADVDFFTTVPRLGRKNSQKIIIELKSKLGSLKELDLTSDTSVTKDVVNALTSLGFSRQEAREALNQVSDQPTLEAKISQAIKLLGKK
ncbi:MAG: Holliday junction branch migration protein RuvA [Candidatus Beckwithbacteria bacterium]|nr:Holliday junction branch migration protein RuvA [Candidatus Beckwithbacteria bacterium]